MRQSRIYTQQALISEGTFKLEGPASHYLTRVLRLSTGDFVTVFNGDGSDYLAEICEIERQKVVLRVTDSQIPGNESPLKITLVQAISRGERMDYSLQKATELGVFCIQPVISRRVEVRLDEKRQLKRLAHWQGVVVSACEQSGRALVPSVKTPISLAEWTAVVVESPRLVLDPLATQKMSSIQIQNDALSLLVGPEGGFNKDEMNALETAGVMAVSLGRRILRTESAGPAAIAVLQAAVGDL
jgi:16S rRNA (uracil1498-N3)-methyltransferase